MGTDPNLIYAVILGAAVLHASWNALIKGSPDTLLSTISITAFTALLSALALPWVAAPAVASWPWIIASALLQTVYMRLLARVYRVTDMSVSYPIMRGTAPLIVALVSLVFFFDEMTFGAMLGIAIICLGIFCIGLRMPGRGRPPRHLHLAFLNAGVIASYTLVGGIGVRLSGAPVAYTLWIFLLLGIIMLAIARLKHPDRALLPYMRAHWGVGLFGGFGNLVSYLAALWAMTLAPIAVIAALRETSILFGTLISALILREQVTVARVVGACILVVGAVVLRLT